MLGPINLIFFVKGGSGGDISTLIYQYMFETALNIVFTSKPESNQK